MTEANENIKLKGEALTRGGRDYSRLLNVHADISIVLGERRVELREIASIGIGSIVELDRMLGEPVDLYVNDEPFAEGEIVVVNDRYGMRIISIHGVATHEAGSGVANLEALSDTALQAAEPVPPVAG